MKNFMVMPIVLAICLTGLLLTGTGAATRSDAAGNQALTGYFSPGSGEYDPYPYYNILGGAFYAPAYEFDLPNQFESPFNPGAALSRHGIRLPRNNTDPRFNNR
jgi:hypothetical protein